MGKLAEKGNNHQQLLANYLQVLAEGYNTYPSDQLQHLVITDFDHGHFQLTRTGWHDRRYHFQVLIHIDVKADGKIWIQLNNTEILLAEELEKKGVHKSNIVLGFKPEYMRPGTGYAA